MSGDIVQARYEELEAVAARFGRAAEASAEMQRRLLAALEPLEQGGWEGRGAAAFFAEMRRTTLPGVQRLIAALELARSVTIEVTGVLRAAEEEAARPFGERESVAAVVDGGRAQGSAPGGGGGGGGLWARISEPVHTLLDLAGFIPGFGEVADGANALIYLAEGRTVEASISAVAMIPLIGDVGKVGKLTVKAGKEIVEEVAETAATRGARELVEEGGERGARETAESLGEAGGRGGGGGGGGGGRAARESDEFLRFGELAPNASYMRNGYTYATDELGRVKSVTGELQLETAARTGHQTEIGRMGEAGDVGGHLIGSRFFGTPEGVNIVPMNGQLNNSAWKKMENEWAGMLNRTPPVPVKVEIEVFYGSAGSTRPSSFRVHYNDADGLPKSREFLNQAGG